MDRAEIDNFLEIMYASELVAQQTVVNPEKLALSPSVVPVVLSMPHHSHVGGDGLPAVQAGTGVVSEAVPQKERAPATRRGVHNKIVLPAEVVTIAGLELPMRGSRPAPAGSTWVLQRKRRQNDSGGEEEDDVEITGARQQKKARQAPPKALADVAKEVAVSDLDSFAVYAEFLNDGEREFLYHLCERLGFSGSRPRFDQSPFNTAFGHISVGLHEMFLVASKQPRVERELREEVAGLQRDLGEAQDRLADVERRLTKADCDAADARGKLVVAIERDLERNDQFSKLEQDMSLLQDRVAAKDKKVEILQREFAASLAEVKRLEGEVARLGAEGSRAAAAAMESFKQSTEYKKALTEAAKAGALANVEMLQQKGTIDWAKASMPVVPPAKDAPPAKGIAPSQVDGARSGSGESGTYPADDSQRTPTQSEVSHAGFLEAHTQADGIIETPSPTARGSDQTSRQHPPPHAEGSRANPANP
ncbi:uncharacterized protein LOC112163902 [Rosa chinensis]|uniref:uncharacterized protein LOC112163902 n=1 Tax=Rosa chinensis TaxID=74649 RepID=UPI000D08F6D8|nr:uncharacterized protein LOC112163902 [Rosa chinensis]XP_040362700.1 uncharacterized protein LOC112163902 [Rosa chinensis]XP_040362701.1 uncharacterized protein LOC112163902 [Rosa chinensis]XP_040362702.1 uncharacterized protein LOC112163902 [Rosa chinensis]